MAITIEASLNTQIFDSHSEEYIVQIFSLIKITLQLHITEKLSNILRTSDSIITPLLQYTN